MNIVEAKISVSYFYKMEETMNQNIYHYTSIETLLLILKNHTLRFSSLLVVDDLEEVNTSDYGELGRFAFVSCWTKADSESIPLWNLYTKNMDGVRIKLSTSDIFQTEEAVFQDGGKCNIPVSLKQNNLDKLGVCLNPPYYLQLIDITYTSNEDLLYPKVYSYEKTKNGYNKKIDKIDSLGIFKRKTWEFQKESRFKFFLAPWSIKELGEIKDSLEHAKVFDRLQNEKLPFSYIDLLLSDNAFDNFEVLLGPKVTEAQEQIVRLICSKYLPTTIISRSNLKIQ